MRLDSKAMFYISGRYKVHLHLLFPRPTHEEKVLKKGPTNIDADYPASSIGIFANAQGIATMLVRVRHNEWRRAAAILPTVSVHLPEHPADRKEEGWSLCIKIYRSRDQLTRARFPGRFRMQRLDLLRPGTGATVGSGAKN